MLNTLQRTSVLPRRQTGRARHYHAKPTCTCRTRGLVMTSLAWRAKGVECECECECEVQFSSQGNPKNKRYKTKNAIWVKCGVLRFDGKKRKGRRRKKKKRSGTPPGHWLDSLFPNITRGLETVAAGVTLKRKRSTRASESLAWHGLRGLTVTCRPEIIAELPWRL